MDQIELLPAQLARRNWIILAFLLLAVCLSAILT